jgi:hypothetical protein
MNNLRAHRNLNETGNTYLPIESKTIFVESTTSVSTQSLLGIFTCTKGVPEHSTDRVVSAIKPQKLIYCIQSIQWHL